MNARTGPIQVGLIGGGGVADAHIRGYRRYADTIALAAVADADPETAARRAAELGVVAYTDYLQMLAETELDAVDICLPHHLHADAIVAAAEAGKHILCEKPLCLTAPEAVQVRDAVRGSGVTLMCAHNQLFLPSVVRAKELLDEGALGQVYEVRATDCFVNDFDPATMGWRAHAKTSGGGELIDTGYHPSYLLLHLAGGQPVEVAAMLSRHRLHFMEGEDSAQLLVRFDHGVVGQLVTSWAFDPPADTERFAVTAELGSLRGDARSLTVARRGEPVRTEVFEPVDDYEAEIGHFGECLTLGQRPLHTEEEGLAVLGLILAAYESARSGSIARVLHDCLMLPVPVVATRE